VTLCRVELNEQQSMEHSPGRDDWQQWLREHAGKFLRFARQQTRSEADARDIVQEAVVEARERCGGDDPPLDGGAVRMTTFNWVDQVVLKDTARGVVIEQSAPHVQVVPVNLQTY
jgi:DNA-directed RNA polymerase specialized sigma24 family protein